MIFENSLTNFEVHKSEYNANYKAIIKLQSVLFNVSIVDFKYLRAFFQIKRLEII